MTNDVIEAIADAIRAEIVKGWDFPLSTTPESQAKAGAEAALTAAEALGWKLVPTRGPGFEAMVDRMMAAHPPQAVRDDLVRPIRASLLRAALKIGD